MSARRGALLGVSGVQQEGVGWPGPHEKVLERTSSRLFGVVGATPPDCLLGATVSTKRPLFLHSMGALTSITGPAVGPSTGPAPAEFPSAAASVFCSQQEGRAPLKAS